MNPFKGYHLKVLTTVLFLRNNFEQLKSFKPKQRGNDTSMAAGVAVGILFAVIAVLGVIFAIIRSQNNPAKNIPASYQLS